LFIAKTLKKHKKARCTIKVSVHLNKERYYVKNDLESREDIRDIIEACETPPQHKKANMPYK
jgi:hypothetical protein